MGIRPAVLCVLFVFAASACGAAAPASMPQPMLDTAQTANDVPAARDSGTSSSSTSTSVSSSSTAISHISVSSSSTSSSVTQSVVSVSVSTDSGSASRTVTFDGNGKLTVRVTAENGRAPVIEAELVR